MPFVSSLICRWHHYLWSRYRFSRALSWSRHAFCPGFSHIFRISSRLFWTSPTRFSRSSSSSWHTFWQSPSLVSLFSPRSCRTSYSWFSRFHSGPKGPWGAFFPFDPLLPRGPFSPVRPGYPGGPAGHTFSLDLQYLVGISFSICVVISFRTSFIVMVRSWSTVRNLSPVSWLCVCSWFPWFI